MMKLWRRLITISLICGIWFSPGCKKESESETTAQPQPVPQKVQPEPQQDWSQLALGEQVSFEMTYRGCTGTNDDINISCGWYGFSERDCKDKPFLKAVKDQTNKNLLTYQSEYFPNDGIAVLEYENDTSLTLFFDLDNNGKISDDEILKPVENARQQFGNGSTFVTPDFEKTTESGDKIPFRIMACTSSNNGNRPNIYWTPVGMYEGSATIDSQKYNIYLFTPFHAKSYTRFGRSDIAFVKADDEDHRNRINGNTLSSINLFNDNFYRIKFDSSGNSNKTLTATLAEDKGPRGKVEFKLKGQQDLKAKLTYASIYGDSDNTVNFNIKDGFNELPVGTYKISYGRMDFGKDNTDEFNTSFEGWPKFTIETDKTTTVEFGDIKTEITAVEYNQRYRSNKEFKDEFPENTHIYLDVDFTGLAGESYRDFYQVVDEVIKRPDGSTNTIRNRNELPVHLTISDSNNNVVESTDLEYG